MNILIVRPTGGYSGAERYNIFLIEGLKEIFPKVNLIYLTNQKQFIQKLEEEGTIVFFYKLLIKEIGTKKDLLKSFFIAPYFIWNSLNSIKKIEKEEKLSIICLQSMTEKILLTPILVTFHYKVVWLEHGPLFVTRRTSIIKKLYTITSFFIKKIIVVSENTKSDLIEGGINKDKLITIPGSIDVNYFSPRNSTKLGKKNKMDKKLIIGFSGNINKEKGIIEFIAVSNLLLNKNKNISFLIIGSGLYLDWAKNKVKALKIDEYFQFVGFQEDIKQYLEMIDIFFFPTNHNEGLSMSLLEAAAMELLLFTHDIGGNKEIVIDGETGFLYKKFDLHEITKKLLDLIENYNSYEKVRKNARKLIVEKYDNKFMGEKFYMLMSSLITNQ